MHARALASVMLAVALAACTTPRPPAMHVEVPRAVVADDPDAITISWIGHATILIGIHGHWILTDPVFSDRLAGTVTRGVRAAIAPGELPPLDAIVISHAHFDHLDLPSLRALPAAPLLVPAGLPAFLDDVPQHAVALDTGQVWQHGELRITAVPASHGDGRYWLDRWHTRTHTGWVIEAGGRAVYFAGDTGYIADDARALGRRFAIDVALIPVGPTGRAEWVERLRASVHANPEAALSLFGDTGARWMVPIHFGTFFQPPDRERPLVEAAIARRGLGDRVRVLAIGETAVFRAATPAAP